MISSRRTRLRADAARASLASVAVLALLALSACSGAADGSEPQTVTVAQGVDPTTMDPLQQRETTTANVLQHLYDPLIERDADDPTEYLPGLAESWSQVDETTYEFVLRSDVTFSDGSPFDAEDVVYTIEYVLGEVTGSPALISANFANLEGAEAIDEHTVHITTSAPTPLLIPRLTGLFIIPADADVEALASEPVGTGPYTLESWERNARVTLTAREDYYDGAPAIDEVVFETIADSSARIAGLGSGSIDIVTGLSPDNVAEVEAGGTASAHETPSSRVVTMWLNTLEEGPMQDRDVRLALNHAVDVDTIIETVMSGYGTRVATFSPDYFFGFDQANEPFAYDPELARSLLADSGYADGFEMEMMVPAGRYPFAEEVAQAIQSYLGEVGVTLNLDIVEFGVFADATNSGNVPESYMAAYGNSTFNPLAEYQMAVRTGDSGYALYSDPELDEIIDEASATVDEDRSRELLSEIEESLLADAPFVYLYAQIDIYGVSERLDWTPRMDESINLYDATIAP